MKKIIRILPDKKEKCLLIKGAFSKQFCQNLIEETKKDFKEAKTHYPTSYRNNERQIKDDERFSKQLFEEIKNYIPKKIQVKGISRKEEGEWELDHLNSRIRICRYLPNQYFNKHLDGVYYESENQQSKLTFMIYLNGNENFKGGRTLFFHSKEDDQIIGSYTAEVGDLIIFDHNLWHSGERVLEGEKYILRSDIIYKRINQSIQNQQIFCAEGHLGYIWNITRFGQQFITGGRDKKIKIWSKEGNKIQAFKAHENSIISLIHQNDKIIVSASRDQSVKIWEEHENEFILRKKLEVHHGTILTLCTINEEEFLTGGADGKVTCMDVSGNIKGHFEAHDEWIWKIEKLNEKIFITASESGELRLWSINNYQLVAEWSDNIPINTITVDEENEHIYIGRMDGFILELECHKTQNGLTKIRETKCHNEIIRCMKVDNDFLFSGSEDNSVRVWKKETMEKKAEFPHDNFVQDMMLDGNSIISVSYDGRIIKNRKPDNS